MAETNSPRGRSGLWQVPLFLCGVLVFSGAYGVHLWRYNPETRQIDRALSKGREQLNNPHEISRDTVSQLERAVKVASNSPERRGELQYVLGSLRIKLAEKLTGEPATKMWAMARSDLEEAKVFEAKDRPRLAYRLAKAMFYLGENPHQVAANLAQSIETGAEDRAEGYTLLTQILLRMEPPRLQLALDANEKLLQLPTTDENVLAPARLLRGELLLQMKDREGARKILSRIGTSAGPEVQSRAHYLLATSYQDDKAWEEAASLWEGVLADSMTKTADHPRIQFWLGTCYRNMNRVSDAETAWNRALKSDGPESQAAALCLARIRLDANDNDAGMALLSSARAQIKRPEDYHNPLISLDQAREILFSGCGKLLESGHFKRATSLSELAAGLGPSSQINLLRGQIAESWAVSLRKNSEQAAREQFFLAGSFFEAALETSGTAITNADVLLRASENYRQAGDFARIVSVLERYLKSQPSVDRLGEAWYRLGEAHLELHNDKLAEGSFSRCIEQSGRYAYLARYQLARAELYHGNPVKAEEILQQNLALLKETDGDAYEKTLYGLGYVLLLNEKYSLAFQRLDLALKLYPNDIGAAQARFQLAECCRHLADAEHPLPGPAIPFAPELQNVRRQHLLWLEKAEAQYQKLVDDLDAQRAVAPLAENQRVLWRDAFFALAKCRSDQGLYEPAASLYETLTGLFQHEYHGLLAFRQLYLTYELLTARSPSYIYKARETVERAQKALKVMDETVFKGRPEVENRAAWVEIFRQALEDLKKDGSDAEP